MTAAAVARDAALGKGLASTSLPDGSFFICHRQPLSGNSYRSTSRISSLHHLHGVEGYNTERYCHGSHCASL
ncbi:hypothetical protein GBA52_001747 [Prunus armeniaca]|nr:hypothetical protein GBA52_001747 [Prunus armeniaca]